MSELDLVIQSIKAAKAASLASVHALEAVERLLGAEAVSKTPPADEPNDEQADCKHADAVTVTTSEGMFLVCGCGEQKEI